MASDYVQVDDPGRLVDREEVLASFRSGERNWDEAHSDDHRVRVYGDVAVVVGRWRARGTPVRPSTTRHATSPSGLVTKGNGEW